MSLTRKTAEHVRDGGRILIQGTTGFPSNQSRPIVDGEEVDDIERALGTHAMRGIPAEDGGEPERLSVTVAGGLKTKLVLQIQRGRRSVGRWVT